MCGRFTLTTNDYEAVAGALDADGDLVAQTYRPRFNIAPTDPHFVVCFAPTGRVLTPGVWGMPGRGTDPSLHINARAETADALPTFSDAFLSGRCGIAADGFYEWTGPRSNRQPIWFHRRPAAVFLFAGLFRDQLDPRTGEVERRFTILTTEPNGLVAPVHDRMPVILAPSAVDDWLRPSADRSEIPRLKALLRPAPDDFLIATEVDPRVSSTDNDDPACIEPRRSPKQQSLF